MKKTLSIKLRLTLWYALVILLICAAAVWMLLSASHRSVREHCEATLHSAAVVIQDELEIEHGYLEIDDDIDEVPNVYAALFHEDGTLIYGRAWAEAPFESGDVREVVAGGHSWYLYDVPITVNGWEGTWLRMYMSSNELTGMRSAARQHGLWFLPLFMLAALAGGYLLTARAFRPVEQMNRLAASVAGGGDLSARIPLNEKVSGNELHRLGATVNGMLERLEKAFQREQQFTSDAAHELRTPLNALITQAEYGLSRDDAAQKDEALKHMLDTAHEMNGTVNHLLMLSRLEAGRMERNDDCMLDEVLENVAQDLQPLAQDRDMTVETQLSPCRMTVNRAMIVRAAVNLLDNAVRYGRDGGRIELKLEKEESGAVITVADDGPGIREEDLPHVFTRFWRADSARSTAGTGVGLALVDSIARAHGGGAMVQSRPGEGAVFCIRICEKEV